MKIKSILTGLAAAAACSFTHATVVVSEGFEDIGTLAGSGWMQVNNNTPLGDSSWFQGNDSVFTAQAGSDTSYIGANYLNSSVGGTISNWLLTPVFSTETGGEVSFWARADILDPHFDMLAFGLVGAAGDVSNVLLPVNEELTGGWVKYTVGFAAMGAGTQARFALHYNGAADDANYIGIDTLTVSTNDRQNVPEPASLGLLALALAGLAGARRGTRQGA